MAIVALSPIRAGQICTTRSEKPVHTVDVMDDVRFHWKWHVELYDSWCQL